jgi:SlyX protein
MDTLEQRLTELEVRLTFLDDTVQALVQADSDKARRIARLERLLGDLHAELVALRQAQSDDPHDEPPPPHY